MHDSYDHYGNLATVKDAHSGTVYWQADTSAAIPAVNAFGTVQAWTLSPGEHCNEFQGFLLFLSI